MAENALLLAHSTMPSLKKMAFAVALLCGVFTANLSMAADVACNGKGVEEEYLSERYSFDVAGSGRLHFHTAPDARCIDKQVFVIPGDLLTGYSIVEGSKEWVFVMYIKKNGMTVNGWVKADRLKFTGASGPDMSPEHAAHYTEAARKAQAGKLGLP